MPFYVNTFLTYIIFILTPLSLIFPWPIKMTIHSPLNLNHDLTQDALEEKVGVIMDQIYN